MPKPTRTASASSRRGTRSGGVGRGQAVGGDDAGQHAEGAGHLVLAGLAQPGGRGLVAVERPGDVDHRRPPGASPRPARAPLRRAGRARRGAPIRRRSGAPSVAVTTMSVISSADPAPRSDVAAGRRAERPGELELDEREAAVGRGARAANRRCRSRP